MGVTDHSEYVGTVRLANEPGSFMTKLPIAKDLVVHDAADIQRIYLWLGTAMIKMEPIKELVVPEIADSVWKENNQAADQANQPGKFTAFCSYEWTSTPNYANMHRNVFFRDCAKVPAAPFSSIDSQHPEDLWDWMDTQRAKGNELLAISHNANLSDGQMYPIDVDSKGRPIDQAWAQSRDRNERLVELKQIKGQSETHPLLSPNDDFANYEVPSYLLGDPAGRFDHIVGGFARQALKDGITMQDTKGFNPYKFGVVGGSDAHNSASPYRQDNFFGGHASLDGLIEARMSGHLFAGLDVRLENPGGLTGVWAEQNTRASIFDGMQRKETFVVSGPHIKVRFFGGWNYASDAQTERGRPPRKVVPDWLKDQNWVRTAYAQGVPMGGDLPPLPRGKKAPSFAVWAVKDPTSGNLDRIQIVKGWTQNGQSFEKVFDVTWAGDREPDPLTGKVPAIDSTVNVENATYTNTVGSVELTTVWTDPEFDPRFHAFYYARVLEIPTPRWTTIQAHQVGIAPPDVVPATVQERAWTSPIWYTPAADARAAATPGTKVADLTQKGGVALNDAQLKVLIVGKSLWLRNTVTGEIFKDVYDDAGQHIVYHINTNVPQPSEVGDLAQAGYLGESGTYSIQDGKIAISFAGTPFGITVYKMGDKYLAARSNEFGYANYEVITAPSNLINIGKDVHVPAEADHANPQ